MHGRFIIMPTLQVRDLPEDVYVQLTYLAEKEHRSLSAETIVILKEGLLSKIGNKNRRKKILDEVGLLDLNGSSMPDPVLFVREDRDS
jgi:plasmid stability protein